MLSFFRKIHQKLLSQNRVTQYLAYAIGEIILVVIGILIALERRTKTGKIQKPFYKTTDPRTRNRQLVSNRNHECFEQKDWRIVENLKLN